MKKLLPIIALLISLNAKAQDSTYVPFDFEHSEWILGEKWCESPGPWDIVCNTTAYRLIYGGDSTINSVTYKVLNKWIASYLNPVDTFSTPPGYPYALIREDSQKVYVKYLHFQFQSTDEEEVLLYDFTVGVGDTIYSSPISVSYLDTSYYVVESIDSVLTNVGYRKSITLTTSTNYWFDRFAGNAPDDKIVWIEGIGSNKGLLYDLDRQIVEDAGLQWWYVYFLCHTQNNQYAYGTGTCEFITGVQENTADSTFSIYPNPTTHKLNIKLHQKITAGTLQLYNTVGMLVGEYSLAPQIDVSTLPNGLYYLRLQICGQVYAEKIIISR